MGQPFQREAAIYHDLFPKGEELAKKAQNRKSNKAVIQQYEDYLAKCQLVSAEMNTIAKLPGYTDLEHRFDGLTAATEMKGTFDAGSRMLDILLQEIKAERESDALFLLSVGQLKVLNCQAPS